MRVIVGGVAKVVTIASAVEIRMLSHDMITLFFDHIFTVGVGNLGPTDHIQPVRPFHQTCEAISSMSTVSEIQEV